MDNNKKEPSNINPKANTNIVVEDFEIRDCKRAGYILTDEFLGKGSYAKVFLAEPTLIKIRYNQKLNTLQKKEKKLKVNFNHY